MIISELIGKAVQVHDYQTIVLRIVECAEFQHTCSYEEQMLD